jgi:hypothetical protein
MGGSPVQNQDRNVVLSFAILFAALPASLACVAEEGAGPLPDERALSTDASPQSTQPVPPLDERKPDGGAHNPGNHLVCDPEDQRYCLVSRAEDSVPCPERVENLGDRLNCGQLPPHSIWWVQQGPTCLMATWHVRQHQETCFYDTRTGRLIASRGEDPCGVYCGGLKKVQFGEYYPEGCDNTRFAASAQCLADGTEVPVDFPRPSPVDARPADAHPRPGDARRPDMGIRFDAGWPPPPPPWPPTPPITYDAQPPPPPNFYDAQPPPPPVVF